MTPAPCWEAFRYPVSVASTAVAVGSGEVPVLVTPPGARSGRAGHRDHGRRRAGGGHDHGPCPVELDHLTQPGRVRLGGPGGAGAG
jgi:hypothetical protein